MAVVDKPFGKYAHPEVERKFLLAAVPPGSTFSADILDHYIPNTTLRLRRMQTEHEVTFKLGQKLRVHPHETRVIFHTSLYLSEAEYGLLVSTLPTHRLEKRRLRFHERTLPVSVDQFRGPLVNIDQFQGPLDGLVMAELDFGPHVDPTSFPMPTFALAEVTDDERFTGARLALTTSSQAKALLDEFDVK